MTAQVNQAKFLSGQLLLALPGIGDDRFDRAVIAMCLHDENGALGVGIGRALDGLSLHGLLKQLEIEPGVAPDVPVMVGGPVEPQRGFVLHSADWGGDGSVTISNDFVLTSTVDILRAIAEGRGPSQWVVALGYAGWDAGQLDEEMTLHGWLGVPSSPAILFDTPPHLRWQAALETSGIDPWLLTATPGRA